jgi:hypothetical protein
MADITPSPVAEGPFTLASDMTEATIRACAALLKITDPLLIDLMVQGVALRDMGSALLKQDMKALTAGPSPNV